MSDAAVEGSYATVLVVASVGSLLWWVICSVRKKERQLPPPSDYCKRDFK